MNIGPSMGEEERETMGIMLQLYHQIFSFTPGELGDMWITKHVIDTGNTLPVHNPPRRVNPVVHKIRETEL